MKASGYGIVRFDTKTRKITMECYKRLVVVAKPDMNTQFPGWPRTIDKFDNYARKASATLPKLEVRGTTDPAVQIVDEKTNDVVYTVRIVGTEFQAKVFSPGPFTVHVGERRATMRTFTSVAPGGSTRLIADFTRK